jgi:opacity protein-like surface antigen
MNVPMSDFGNVYKSGLSAEAGLFYSLPMTGIDLTLTIGYNGFKYKNDYFTGLVNTNLGVGVDNFTVDWSATVIPIMVGARYKFPAGGINPYISGELGLHMMSFSDRFNGARIIMNSSNPAHINNLTSVTESGSETGFGFAFGAGVEIPVAPKIAIDLGAKYNYGGVIYSKAYNVFTNNEQEFTTLELKNTAFVTIRGGVVINF